MAAHEKNGDDALAPVDAHFHYDLLPQSVRQSLPSGLMGLTAGVWPGQTEKMLDEWGRVSELPVKLWVGSGLHPMEVVSRRMELDAAGEALARLAAVGKLAAIGETGFDLSRDVLREAQTLSLSRDEVVRLQQKAFEICLRVAERCALPLIVHSRKAWQLTEEAVRFARSRGLEVMIHCFPGNANQARTLNASGVYLSFGGVVTWPHAKKMKEAVAVCSEDLLLIETDAPDLSPEWPGGRRPQVNSPEFLPWIERAVADLRGVPAETIRALNRRNLQRFLRSKAPLQTGSET